MISPDGIEPVLLFLKGHHNAQFTNITDIACVDVPSRVNRFEVHIKRHTWNYEFTMMFQRQPGFES